MGKKKWTTPKEPSTTQNERGCNTSFYFSAFRDTGPAVKPVPPMAFWH